LILTRRKTKIFIIKFIIDINIENIINNIEIENIINIIDINIENIIFLNYTIQINFATEII